MNFWNVFFTCDDYLLGHFTSVGITVKSSRNWEMFHFFSYTRWFAWSCEKDLVGSLVCFHSMHRTRHTLSHTSIQSICNLTGVWFRLLDSRAWKSSSKILFRCKLIKESSIKRNRRLWIKTGTCPQMQDLHNSFRNDKRMLSPEGGH